MGCGFSFVHCADLHLGSRAWGFTHGDRELSDRFFGTSFRSFSRIVDVCIDRADSKVIAGEMKVLDELKLE
ncbi:MAG: hypothetical protein MJZ38_05485, partial [archaeon]|nr:hypothetical protein [archaeon]